jgi:hypothetical protein
MKRSEAILSLSEKLQKSQNLLDGYKNGSIDLKCLCDNLATRAVDYCVDEIEMLPPKNENFNTRCDMLDAELIYEWETEDEA